MDTQAVKRVQVLNVPVDMADQEQALKAVEKLLVDGGRHQIVFLDRQRLFKARRNPEFRRCLREAALVLPISEGIVRGARFLGRGELTRFESFPFVIRLLSLAERLNRTVYLLGSRKQDLEKAERNLKDSFPALRLVGRFSGFISKAMKKDVLLAIKKASPAFLLAGNGLPARDLWLLRHKKELQPGIYLWVGECFDYFSGRKNRRARLDARRLVRPWRILRLFPLLYYWVLLIVHRIFKL